jgi:hypothetical protein
MLLERKLFLRSASEAILALVFVALLAAPLTAGSMLEFGTKAVYTSNLKSDASSTSDVYITNNTSINLYPFPFAELNINGMHKAHRDTVRYDNRTGGVGLTVVPTRPESPLALYANVLFNGSRFGKGLQSFNSNTFSVRTAAGYWIGESVRLRLGLFYQDNAYIQSDEMDRVSYEVYSGVNFTFLGANALDIEAGFADAKYSYISPDGLLLPPEDPDIIDKDLYYVTFSEGHLESFYISPRFSRPIGPRSGMSVTFTYKEFPDLEEGVVYSASTSNLSPWTEAWQGRSVTACFKTYLIPHTSLSAEVGYSNRSFLRIHDDPDQVSYKRDTARHDEQTTFNVEIRRPVANLLGFSGEPSLSIDWTNNSSTKTLYDYHSFSITLGFKLRL